MKMQQQSKVSISEVLKRADGPAGTGGGSSSTARKGESLEELCKCEVMQPGYFHF